MNKIELLEKVVKFGEYKMEIETSYNWRSKESFFIVSCGCAYGKGLKLEEAIDNCLEDAKELGYYE